MMMLIVQFVNCPGELAILYNCRNGRASFARRRQTDNVSAYLPYPCAHDAISDD